MKKGMQWETREQKMACARALFPNRDKVHESVDPKPVDLMERFDYIMSEKANMLHSFQGAIQSEGAQQVSYRCDFFVLPSSYHLANTTKIIFNPRRSYSSRSPR